MRECFWFVLKQTLGTLVHLLYHDVVQVKKMMASFRSATVFKPFVSKRFLPFIFILAWSFTSNEEISKDLSSGPSPSNSDSAESELEGFLQVFSAIKKPVKNLLEFASKFESKSTWFQAQQEQEENKQPVIYIVGYHIMVKNKFTPRYTECKRASEWVCHQEETMALFSFGKYLKKKIYI